MRAKDMSYQFRYLTVKFKSGWIGISKWSLLGCELFRGNVHTRFCLFTDLLRDLGEICSWKIWFYCMHPCIHACIHTHIYICTTLRVYLFTSQICHGIRWSEALHAACPVWWPVCCRTGCIRCVGQEERSKIGAGNIPTKESPWHNSCFLNLASSTSKYLVVPVCRSLERFRWDISGKDLIFQQRTLCKR